ncbi:MAG: glycoside hydrolase family 5 protein, partial [Balneolaceae bacterium]
MKVLFSLVLCLFIFVSCSKDSPTSSGDGTIRDITSFELVSEMGSGWNLGNSFDAIGEDETVWGNPHTTRAMIDEISARGFKTIRIPITWGSHLGAAPDYIIEPDWLSRIEQVVNYALDNDMYVIINIHHDESWVIPTFDKASEVSDQLEKVWTQVANRFIDYDEHLIFETLNEPRHKNTPEEWTGGTSEGRTVLNQYHKASLDAIRATGENNALRHIMISTYAASSIPIAMNELVIPNDDERVIISIHSYFPYPFTLGESDPTWGTEADKLGLDAELDRMKAKFIDNGRPIVMGEWGSINQDNYQDRLTHARYYAEAAAERGIVPIWWDNGALEG